MVPRARTFLHALAELGMLEEYSLGPPCVSRERCAPRESLAPLTIISAILFSPPPPQKDHTSSTFISSNRVKIYNCNGMPHLMCVIYDALQLDQRDKVYRNTLKCIYAESIMREKYIFLRVFF